MKRVCWALVGGGIAWAIILLMVYWCTEWRASPCVVTPRAATAEATAEARTTPTFLESTDGQTPGLMATWDAEQAATIRAVSSQMAMTHAAGQAERMETVCAGATRSTLWATICREGTPCAGP